jgi:murein DD-endopeptidase MepM/ murein hydrolase activator NlpD
MARLLTGRGVIPPPVPPVDPAPVTPLPVIPTPPTPVDVLALPMGNVTTPRPNSTAPFNIPWSNVSRWEPSFTKWAKHYGTNPLYLALITIIESDANQYKTGKLTGTKAQVITRDDGFRDGLSVGLSQIKPKLWGFMAPTADPYTPDGNIQLATAFLANRLDARGQKIEEVIRRDYFPVNDPNGTTQNAYVDTFRALLTEASPKPIPQPPPTLDPLTEMFRGKAGRITYGFGADEGLPYYDYGVGHGLSRATQHTGDDIPLPYGTPIYAPLAGKITCVGTAGSVTWGQGCGFFTDTGDAGPGSPLKGVGNITLLTDAGLKIVFGHCRTSHFKVGDRVQPGMQLGTSGGQNGAHCHLEVAEQRNGTYWLLNPIPALRAAMNGAQPGPSPVITDIIWEGTPNFHDRGGQAPVAITYHMTDDLSFSNVKSWFQNPRSRASAHWVIPEDGTKHQFVGSAKASWSNGIIKNPRTDILWMNEAVRQVNLGRRNFNDYTINLEFIGKPGRAFTDRAIRSGIEIVRYYVAISPGITPNRGHHLRHADIDSVDRPFDPGPLFPLADIMRAVGADPLRLNP